MRGLRCLALALAASAGLSGAAMAQQRGGMGMGGMADASALLGNPAVQKELKLDEAQQKKADAFAEEMQGKRREAFTSLQDVPQDERMGKMREMMKTFNEEGTKVAGDMLKPDQLKRFKQIEVQAMGVNAFEAPAVRKALKITDAQKSTIDEMIAAAPGEMREIMQDNQGDRAEMMKRMTEYRKGRMEKAMALMSEEQKGLWKDLTGDPFELPMQARPGGRRPNN